MTANSDSLQQLSTLLKESPAQVEAWVRKTWTEGASEEFNWLGLAQGALSIAQSKPDTRPNQANLNWARVAVLIFEYLIDSNFKVSRRSIKSSMMNLRVYMIKHFGSVEGDNVLDANLVINWFFSELEMSYENAAEKTAKLSELSLSEIRNLRDIKNRLSILKGLRHSNAVSSKSELNRWLSLLPKLP